ncbi:MAG: AzlD domain-containing protein [Acidimicrobiales bacterium]
MSSITALALVLVVGAITYAMRAGLILALADREIPTIVTRALRNVAPAVLSTLVISLIANPDAPNVGISLPEVAGVVVAGPVAWYSKNLLVTMAAGMVVFWVLLALT